MYGPEYWFKLILTAVICIGLGCWVIWFWWNYWAGRWSEYAEQWRNSKQ